MCKCWALIFFTTSATIAAVGSRRVPDENKEKGAPALPLGADMDGKNTEDRRPKAVLAGKNARRLKLPKSANSYLLLDKVVPDAARVPDKSDINDLEDFLLAMRAGQRMSKEKILESRRGSAVPSQANKKAVASRSIKETRNSEESGMRRNFLHPVHNSSRNLEAVHTNERKTGSTAPDNTGQNSNVEREFSASKKRQGVYGLQRIKEVFGPPGAGSLRGPVDFPGAPNYVPAGILRKVGAPRGPYTTPAYGPRPPPPVQGRKKYTNSEDPDSYETDPETDYQRGPGSNKSAS